MIGRHSGPEMSTMLNVAAGNSWTSSRWATGEGEREYFGMKAIRSFHLHFDFLSGITCEAPKEDSGCRLTKGSSLLSEREVGFDVLAEGPATTRYCFSEGKRLRRFMVDDVLRRWAFMDEVRLGRSTDTRIAGVEAE